MNCVACDVPIPATGDDMCADCNAACPCYTMVPEPVWCPVHERMWSKDTLIKFTGGGAN